MIKNESYARADELRARASHVTVVSQDTPPQVTDCGGLLVSSFVTIRLSTLSLTSSSSLGRASLVSSVKTRHVSWSSL